MGLGVTVLRSNDSVAGSGLTEINCGVAAELAETEVEFGRRLP